MNFMTFIVVQQSSQANFITFPPQTLRACPHPPTSFVFLGPHLWHMKVPRLGIKSELPLPAYTTAVATPDPSCIWDLHCSLWQHQILNPLSKARDQTRILMDTMSGP